MTLTVKNAGQTQHQPIVRNHEVSKSQALRKKVAIVALVCLVAIAATYFAQIYYPAMLLASKMAVNITINAIISSTIASAALLVNTQMQKKKVTHKQDHFLSVESPVSPEKQNQRDSYFMGTPLNPWKPAATPKRQIQSPWKPLETPQRVLDHSNANVVVIPNPFVFRDYYDLFDQGIDETYEKEDRTKLDKAYIIWTVLKDQITDHPEFQELTQTQKASFYYWVVYSYGSDEFYAEYIDKKPLVIEQLVIHYPMVLNEYVQYFLDVVPQENWKKYDKQISYSLHAGSCADGTVILDMFNLYCSLDYHEDKEKLAKLVSIIRMTLENREVTQFVSEEKKLGGPRPTSSKGTDFRAACTKAIEENLETVINTKDELISFLQVTRICNLRSQLISTIRDHE